MRVLHLFKTYLPESFTGIEHVIYEIAESTAPLGIATDVLSLSANPQPGPIAIGHHHAHQSRRHLDLLSTGLSVSVFGDFRRLAARADVVHYHFPWPMMDAVHLLSRLGKPSVVTYHSDIVRQRRMLALYRPLRDAFLHGAQRIVATSPNYVESSDVLRAHRARLTVIPIGIGEAAPARQDLLDTWRQRTSGPFFLFVGTLRYYKGLPFLAEAARRTGYPVLVIGDGGGRAALEAAGVPSL